MVIERLGLLPCAWALVGPSATHSAMAPAKYDTFIVTLLAAGSQSASPRAICRFVAPVPAERF
jgi:hypothetical protein